MKQENRHIQAFRDAALDVLKPNKRELEHGLELHRNSLVWDAYGFLPACRPPKEFTDRLCDPPYDRVENGNRREEFMQFDGMRDPGLYRECREFVKAAGVDAVFQNSGVEHNSIEELIKRLSRFSALPEYFPECYAKGTFPQDVLRAKEQGKCAVCLTTNAVPIPAKFESEETALYYLTVFSRFGVRMMHLTYNRRNMIGDGCAEARDAGLSGFGEQVVREMNRVGIIPDAAHSSNGTAISAAEVSSKPVVISHACASALSTHYRAKSDEAIAAVKKTGGFIGICTHAKFFRGSGMIDSFLNHIEYVANKFGADTVAIGTDYDTCVGNWDENPWRHPPFRPALENFWTQEKNPFLPTERMMASVAWCNWPLYTVGLVQRGFSDEEIRKMIGGNVMRVVRATMDPVEPIAFPPDA